MTELNLEIDPLNPAEYYACCGILEILSLSGYSPVSAFRCEPTSPRHASFRTESTKELAELADELRNAASTMLERPGAGRKDPIAPARLIFSGRSIDLDWWLNVFRDQKSPLKCWSGQVTTRKLFQGLPRLIPTHADLSSHAFTSTRFGTDPRSAWEALDLGYSPNEHNLGSRAYPLTELLAAFGLQGFRPIPDRRSCNYNLWLDPLPIEAARAASLKPWDGLHSLRCTFQIGTRGSYRYFSFAEIQPEPTQKEATDE